MDRFIGNSIGLLSLLLAGLKSNMDRFIDHQLVVGQAVYHSLKSNMDRFIACVMIYNILFRAV